MAPIYALASSNKRGRGALPGIFFPQTLPNWADFAGKSGFFIAAKINANWFRLVQSQAFQRVEALTAAVGPALADEAMIAVITSPNGKGGPPNQAKAVQDRTPFIEDARTSMIEFFTPQPVQPAPTKPSTPSDAKNAQAPNTEPSEKDATFADALSAVNEETQASKPQQTNTKPADEKAAAAPTDVNAVANGQPPIETAVAETNVQIETAEIVYGADLSDDQNKAAVEVAFDDAADDNTIEIVPIAVADVDVKTQTPAEMPKAITNAEIISADAKTNEGILAATPAETETIEVLETEPVAPVEPAATAAAAIMVAQPSAVATLTAASTPKGLAAKATTQPIAPASAVPGEALAPLKAGDTIASEADLSKALDAADPELNFAQDKAVTTPDKAILNSTAAMTFEQTVAAQSPETSTDTALGVNTAKNTIADNPAAKPLPEVIVQVPQQRADMAAKQVGLELARQVKNGDTQFVVRMDPPELGKLDVRITINKVGEIQANIVVEREATLDLLNKDARTLERSLTEAGVKMEQNALNLCLKQNDSDTFGNAMANGDGTGGTQGSDDGQDDELMEIVDGAALAQIQIASGRPLDVTI